MTSEDEFQAMLDANPDDWQTRLIFADWLEDRADVRADGYRALGHLRRVPVAGKNMNDKATFWCYTNGSYVGAALHPQIMPDDWRALIGDACLTRREMEDEAARVFAMLPAHRRCLYLNLPVPA